MKAEIICGNIFSEDGKSYKTYGFKIGHRVFEDVSLNKVFVERFVQILNDDPDPITCIDEVLEDYMAKEEYK